MLPRLTQLPQHPDALLALLGRSHLYQLKGQRGADSAERQAEPSADVECGSPYLNLSRVAEVELMLASVHLDVLQSFYSPPHLHYLDTPIVVERLALKDPGLKAGIGEFSFEPSTIQGPLSVIFKTHPMSSALLRRKSKTRI